MEDRPRVFLTGKRRERFEGFQYCLVPRSRKFTREQKECSHQLINELLTHQPAAVHFKLALFLLMIDFVSLLRGFHTFKNLREEQQHAVMNSFFDSPLSVLRKGFWGLNTLAKLGVYGQSSVYTEIGYTLRLTPR